VIWDQLRGHKQQQDMFRRAIDRDRVAHAYLLIGPHGIGKRLFAKLLTQCLFCENVPNAELDACGQCSNCKQIQAGSHPDLFVVQKPDGAKELPIRLLVGDTDSRGREGLCHDLSLRPMSAGRRVAVIDDAETMGEAGANSLLKTLEEPPVGSIMFLIAPSEDRMLPTIRSRCQPIQFAPLSEADVRDILVDQQLETDPGTAQNVAAMAEGSLVTAQQLLDVGLSQLRQSVEVCLSKTPFEAQNSARMINAVLSELGGDTAQQRKYMNWVIKFAVKHLQKLLRECTDITQIERYANMLDRCFAAEMHLFQTMPVPLCLDAWCDELGQLSRQAVPVSH